MALMSVNDFLTKKDAPAMEASHGYISANDLPSNNTPTAKANITKPHGLMSVEDFKKSLNKPDVVTPPPTLGVSPDVQSFTDSINKPKYDILHPDPNSMLGKVQNIQNTPKGGWNGILDNPIVNTFKAIDKGVTAFQDAGGNSMSFGLHNKALQSRGEQARIDNENSVAGTVGGITGDLVGIGKLYKGGAALTKTLLPNAGKLTKLIAPGLIAGAGYQTAKEAVDMAIPSPAGSNDLMNPNGIQQKTLGDRGLDIAKSAALFAGGDVALKYAGKGIKALSDKTGLTSKISQSFDSMFKKPIDSAPIQTGPTLGLPEPKSAIMARELQNRSILPTNETPIYGQGDIHTFGLPEGKYTVPTRLKVNSPTESLDYVMTKIKPEVMNIIEAPTRRDLLVQYVQKNTQIPVDEIHNMPIETLKSVGQDVQDSLHKNMQQIAFDVAKQHGHDLPALLEGQAPNLRAQIARDTQSQVYGVPAPRVDIQKPNFNIIHNADAAMPETKIGFNPVVKPKVDLQSKNVADQKILNSEVPKAKEQPINAQVPSDVVPHAEPRIRDKVTNYLDEAAQAARERLKAKRNTLSSNPVDQYADYAIIGASHIANGVVKFADFSTKMIADFGESIKPHLKEIFNRSKGAHKDAERQASGVAHLPGVNSGIDPLKGDKVDVMSLEKAIENSAAWKDKNRLLLNRETTERNFEDVMGKDAKIMNKTYIEPIQKSAADRQRFITKERNDIKDLGIKYKSPEDALVQKYGEGKMSELELRAASPQNWQKIKTAAETMRSKYDEYLNAANEVLKRNGYPEIPKRKDYFPHYEEIDGLMSKLGFGFEDNTLPSDLNGITANLKPGKNFFTHALQRKGNDTTLGAIAGHDRYIEGISKIIHQTDNIKRLRGLDKTLRDTNEGTTHLSDFLGNLTDYTNILAGKKTEMDRSLEAATGRNLYSTVDWLKRRVGANMIGGSVSSALTNTIPVTQLLAETSKTSVLKGLTSALQNLKGNDAIGQESNFLARRFTSDKLAMGPIDKAQKAAGVLFKGIDHFTSNVVMRSKYFENIKKGMPEAEALHAADQYATRMMADRSEGSMPTLFHSRTFGLITQFQLEVNNQLSHLFKDMPKSMSKTKYVSAITQVLVYDYLYNQIYEKVTGNRPAFDPLGVAANAVQDYTNPRLSKGKASGNMIGNIANNLPFASVATGGRIPLGAAMPNVFGANGLIKGNAKLGDELLKPAKYLALPFGGSQINKTVTGLMAVSQGGVHGKDPQGKDILKYPIAKTPANIARGALFGKSALPETNNFYSNNTPALTADETKGLSKHGNDPKMYNKIMIQKQMNTLDDKFSKIDNNPNLSKAEKRSQIDAIKSKMRELKVKLSEAAK